VVEDSPIEGLGDGREVSGQGRGQGAQAPLVVGAEAHVPLELFEQGIHLVDAAGLGGLYRHRAVLHNHLGDSGSTVLKIVLVADVHREHLVFACGARLYAIPAEAVAEVVILPELTRVPGTPVHVMGVFSLRGELMPVVDLARLAGHPLEEDFRRAVLMRSAQGAVVLTATKVVGVVALEGSPERLAESGFEAHLRGPARVPAGDAFIIDPEDFFDFLARGAA
jgi:purine-binding chemotaxis protein CheW